MPQEQSNGANSKLHWTQRPGGAAKMSATMKLAWKKKMDGETGEKKQVALKRLAAGDKASTIAKELKVHPSTIYYWRTGGEAKKRREKAARVEKAPEKQKFSGNTHRLALKVRRGTVLRMQAGVDDYLIDVLLLTQEVLGG